MPDNNNHNVITYADTVKFNYSLPDEEEQKVIERDVTLLWEESLEKLLEEHGANTEYTVHKFKREREQNLFIERIDGELEDLIDEVQEEIANKTKFGFDFSGQLHNDD